MLFDGREFDIVRDINPEGGKERPTGLVTRFTICPCLRCPAVGGDAPVLGRLDISIIANAFMEDFNRDTVRSR